MNENSYKIYYFFSKPKASVVEKTDYPCRKEDNLHPDRLPRQLQARPQLSWTSNSNQLLLSTTAQQPPACDRISIDTTTAALSAVKNHNNNNNSTKLNQLTGCCPSSLDEQPDEFFSDISFSSSESEIFSDLSGLEVFDSSLSGLDEPVTSCLGSSLSGLDEPVTSCMDSSLFFGSGDKCFDYCPQLLMLRQDL